MIDGEYYKVYDLDILSINDFFYIYDENGELEYRKDSSFIPGLSLEDINLIPCEYRRPIADEDDYLEFESDNFIYLDLGYYDNLVNVSNDYYILDSDLKIIDTNVENNKEVFTERELELIQGNYLEHWMVSKLHFKNKDGEEKIAVIFRDYSLSNCLGSEKRGYESIRWILLIIIFIIATPIYILTLYKNIKEPLFKLDNAIKELSKEEGVDLIKYEGPKEFQSVFNDFNDMATKLEKSRKVILKEQLINRKIIANISHDLKTPLTVIQGYSNAFLDHEIEDKKKNEYALKINEKTQVMNDLISELNEYSKLNHPEFNVKMENKDILEYFRNYFSIKYDEIEFFGYSINVEIPEGKIHCRFDDKYLSRVFDNIINNTIEHTDKGTNICFKVGKDKNNVLIEIGDNGPGIPPEYIKQIFKPFTTNDDARGKGGGLGMTIAKMIIKYHDGSINVKDDNSNKLVYEIKLPRNAI